jgi:hypothetical protein
LSPDGARIALVSNFHGFKRPSFIENRYRRWFDWCDRYVKGSAP